MALTQTIERPSERLAPETHEGEGAAESAAPLAPLWVGGIALLCLLLGFVLTGPLSAISARADVWVPYLLLGTLFPLLVAAVVLAERSGRTFPAWLGIGLTALPIVAVALLAGAGHSLLALGLALGQTLLCLVLAGWPGMRLSVRRQTPESLTIELLSRPLGMPGTRVLALLVMGFLAWSVALELLTWDRLVIELPPSWHRVLGGAIALLACCRWAFGRASPRAGSRRLQWVADSVCLVGLVALAFRTDGLFAIVDPLGPFLHWSAFVGPAEAVRQGGWLLWDVPFQYGFLNTLSLLAVPVPTAWQSLYLLNAIGSALVALFLFDVLRAVRPTVVGTLVAGAVSAAVVFLLPNIAQWLFPQHHNPSVGVIRYGWCYVLVGVLLLERRQEPRSRAQQGMLLAGCGGWLLAILWSAESAFYGSAIWLPAFVLIVLRDYGGVGGARDGKRLLSWLAVPLLLLTGTVSLIAVYYGVRLGHGPDPRAYVDAALAYSGYAGTFVAAATGDFYFPDLVPDRPIVGLVFGLVLLVMAAAALARTTSGLRDLPTALGLAFGVWAVASYAVGLPWPYAVYRPLPLLVLGLGILLGIIAPRYRGLQTPSWVSLLKAGTIPLLTVLLVTAYTNGTWLQVYAEDIRREGFIGGDVTVGLPSVDPSLATLLTEAKVQASDPILYAGAEFGDMMPVWTPAGEDEPVVVSRQWMAAPLTILSVFPDERKHLYMARSTQRQGGGGWLIERRQDGVVVDQEVRLDPWLFEYLDRTHVPTKIAQNAEWQLVWYEPKGNADGAALVEERTGRVPGVPADLLVNGEALADSVLPPVWGYFGPEWTDPPIDRGRRCTSGTGTLYVFTPSPLEAQIALSPPAGGFGGTVQVALNGGEPVAAEGRRKGGTVQASLALAAGWNTLTIEMTSAEHAPPEADTWDRCAAADPADPPLRLKTVNLRFE